MKKIMESWKGFLKENRSLKEASEVISDEDLLLLFSKEMDDLLLEDFLRRLNEGEFSLGARIKKLAKKNAIPLAMAASILGGTGAYQGAKVGHNIMNPAGQEQTIGYEIAPEKDWARAPLPPGYSNLSNSSSIKKAWEDLMGKRFLRAPVDGGLPTPKGVKAYIYIPAEQLGASEVMPMSLMTAGEYRKFIEESFSIENSRNIVHLKRMIYGTTSKWLSGTGGSNFKFVDGHPVLPPEWSIARDIFVERMGKRLDAISMHLENNPDSRDMIADKLSIHPDQIEAYISKKRFEIQ